MPLRRARDALLAALGPDAQVEHRPRHTRVGALRFDVRVGDRRLWATVASGPEEEHALARWARVAGILAERHGAPPVVEALDIAGHTALLLPHLDARPADRSALRARYDEADDLLAGLHADTELAQLLGGPSTTAACFRSVWLERFVTELARVEGYVAKDLHSFLADEVDALAELVDRLDHPVHSTVHGDPRHERWLVAADRLWLLDWDAVAVGDPVVDDAVLRIDALGSDPHHWPDEPRYAVARRALLLGAVVDGAAAWVAHTDPVARRRNEAAYVAAVETYRDEFR